MKSTSPSLQPLHKPSSPGRMGLGAAAKPPPGRRAASGDGDAPAVPPLTPFLPPPSQA